MDIFVDMDSTMNNFTEGYVNYYNKLHGTSHKIKTKDLVTYEISKCIPGISEEEAVAARTKIFSTPGFWVDIPPYDNMVKTMEWINDNFTTYILTAPWINYDGCVAEKYEWMRKHLPFIPLDRVIFSHNKQVIHSNSLLIDDYPKNLGTFQGRTMKYLYPFNKGAMSNFEAKDWKQVGKLMKGIKKDVDKNGKITKC
jgi:5'(3')-deoxyribonucleotidase